MLRHYAKHFSHINSLNSHNNPVYTCYYSSLLDAGPRQRARVTCLWLYNYIGAFLVTTLLLGVTIKGQIRNLYKELMLIPIISLPNAKTGIGKC